MILVDGMSGGQIIELFICVATSAGTISQTSGTNLTINGMDRVVTLFLQSIGNDKRCCWSKYGNSNMNPTRSQVCTACITRQLFHNTNMTWENKIFTLSVGGACRLLHFTGHTIITETIEAYWRCSNVGHTLCVSSRWW